MKPILLIVIALIVLVVTCNSQTVQFIGIGKNFGGTTPGGGTGGTGSGSADGAYSFTIPSGTWTVSAGVYSGDVLVRTLFAPKIYTAGTYTEYWDGKDDNDVTLSYPASTYKIKIKRNQVTYTWEGTLGNTSSVQSGNTKHQTYYNCMNGIVFVKNGYGYFVNGFSEGEASYSKLLASAPQTKTNFFGSSPSRVMSLNSEYICSDDTLVYIGGFDSYSGSNTMVHAIRTSDDGNVTFLSGTNYLITNGSLTINAIAKQVLANSFITGMAVQKQGIYLFVARSNQNELTVYNKYTGALVQILSYIGARDLAWDSASNSLWMITGALPGTVSKYPINGDGTLAAASLTVTGGSFLHARSISVNPGGTLIAVCDDSTNQVVKFFNNTTGTLTNTLGSTGGYISEADVNDSKFYFHDNNPSNPGGSSTLFVSWQLDGTFWVSDPGNFRVQHYTASRTFIDRLSILGASYSTYVDPNNATRVFAGPLEFYIDYSQALTGSTGWQLVKNWGANFTAIHNRNHLSYPTTLVNGRTYAWIRKSSAYPTNNWEVVELPSTGPLRHTGVFYTGTRMLDQNGDMQIMTKGAIGASSVINKYPRTSFDGSNNPVWSTTPEVLATTPPLTMQDPSDLLTGQCITSTNKIIIFCPDRERTAGDIYTGYHLGMINRNGNSWIWKTENATHVAYMGQYPPASRFDIGNSVKNNAGGTLSIVGQNIITSYHGEFWKSTQTNKFNHYWDDGLAIGQFGTVKEETVGNSPPMYAGNALTPMAVADPNDANAIYLYHGDESSHSGVHRWHITGLNTIATDSVTILYPSAPYTPVLNYVDLMAGVPFNSTLANNTNGWTRLPTADTTGWNVVTNYYTHEKNKRDIQAYFSPNAPSKNYYLYRDLGTNNVTNDWTISCDLGLSGGDGNRASIGMFLEILDVSNKLIGRVSFEWDITPDSSSIRCNGVSIKSWLVSSDGEDFTKYFNNVIVKMVNGIMTVSYAGEAEKTVTISDGTAEWRKPKTLRIRGTTGTGTPYSGKRMIIANGKLYLDIL